VFGPEAVFLVMAGIAAAATVLVSALLPERKPDDYLDRADRRSRERATGGAVALPTSLIKAVLPATRFC
jgi:hypothetical protein